MAAKTAAADCMHCPLRTEANARGCRTRHRRDIGLWSNAAGGPSGLERVKGIEPSYAAWEAAVLPLNYTRLRRIIPFMPLVQRLLGAAMAVLFLLAVLVFTSIVFAILLAGGLVIWAWLWWRSRSLPRHRRTIEGEYRDVTDLERLEEQSRKRL